MRRKTILGVIFLGIIARKIWYLCILLQPWKVVYNHAPGPCHLVPQTGNGSEDIQLLPDGRALISSGMKLPGFSRNPRVMNSFGQFYVFDFNSPDDGAKVVPCKNFPSYGTKYFSPHGISILNNKREIFVFVVNHPPEGNFEKDTIEKFRYDINKDVMEHLKTYKGDYLRLVNDVVAVGPESFYATNWFYSRTKRMQQLETLVAQLDWSNLVFYDNSQSKTAASGFMMANGVNISSDKK